RQPALAGLAWPLMRPPRRRQGSRISAPPALRIVATPDLSGRVLTGWLTGRLAAHVDGVDAGGADGDLDPGLAGLVVGAQVGLVLGAELVGECVVVVRRDLGVAADLQVAIGDGQVEEEHGRGRVRAQVLRLLPGGVKRRDDRLTLGEEPDLRQLRPAVRADSSPGGELAA